ncbi:MAG: PilZ domain-containing protein [Ectothiorhodospiraceae bacterium]|nr:PilZ domain-containing protein [Chromatiales bacterium]MCP5156839.1 PilZ domain-containing protein [Ectothiorhodospiraceae bacterium]
MSDPESTDAAERRRYFRIDDRAAIHYRVLSPDEVQEAVTRLQIGYPDKLALASGFAQATANMRHTMDRFRRDMPDLAAYLEGLNEKIDMLMQLLAANDAELADSAPQEVNLSGSGVSFDIDHEVAIGAAVEVKILVFPSYLCVGAIGEAVYCQPVETPRGRRRFTLGVDFVHIRESDRDLIIRHVTQRQSSLLREARLAIDGVRSGSKG